jgi:hypothetical protein
MPKKKDGLTPDEKQEQLRKELFVLDYERRRARITSN